MAQRTGHEPDRLRAGKERIGVGMRDFGESPVVAIWELTRACDLHCLHCRAVAQPCRDPRELSTGEAFGLVDQLVELAPGVVVLTGGIR